MGSFRFRRSIGVGPFRLNLSKTGVSLTAGVPGAHVNFDLSGRRKHPMATVGLPGTGLSYRTQLGDSEQQRIVEDQQPQPQQSTNEDRLIAGMKRTFEIAAEGQPQDMREIIAYIILEEKKYLNDDDPTGILISMAVRQHFPHMTEQQFEYAIALCNRGVRIAKEEQQAQDQQKPQQVEDQDTFTSGGAWIVYGVGAFILAVMLFAAFGG